MVKDIVLTLGAEFSWQAQTASKWIQHLYGGALWGSTRSYYAGEEIDLFCHLVKQCHKNKNQATYLKIPRVMAKREISSRSHRNMPSINNLNHFKKCSQALCSFHTIWFGGNNCVGCYFSSQGKMKSLTDDWKRLNIPQKQVSFTWTALIFPFRWASVCRISPHCYFLRFTHSWQKTTKSVTKTRLSRGRSTWRRSEEKILFGEKRGDPWKQQPLRTERSPASQC